jgi:hypothetical protein
MGLASSISRAGNGDEYGRKSRAAVQDTYCLCQLQTWRRDSRLAAPRRPTTTGMRMGVELVCGGEEGHFVSGTGGCALKERRNGI